MPKPPTPQNLMPNTKSPKQNDLPNPSDKKFKPNNTPDKNNEFGGPKGPEPTRYGDWEKNGRCIDF